MTTPKLTPIQYAEAIQAALLAAEIETNLGNFLGAKVYIDAIHENGEDSPVEYLALIVDEVEMFRTGGADPADALRQIEGWIWDNIIIDAGSSFIGAMVLRTVPAEA
jgi:hypothetical protein